MDLIQVLGQKDVRREIQVKDENTAGQLLVKNKLARERYVRGLSKTAKKHFINRKDCPVKNHFIGLPKWSREDAVRAFVIVPVRFAEDAIVIVLVLESRSMLLPATRDLNCSSFPTF